MPDDPVLGAVPETPAPQDPRAPYAAVLRRLAAEAQRPKTVESLHALLLGVDDFLGYRPMQVTGPGLKARWHWSDADAEHVSGQLLELSFDSPIRTFAVGVHDTREVTRDEAVFEDGPSSALEEIDPDRLRFDDYVNSYLWNLDVAAGPKPANRESWLTYLEAPAILTWEMLIRELGATLRDAPHDLAALPPTWFDGELRLTDRSELPGRDEPGCLDLTLSRRGLRVRMTAVGASGLVGVSFAFTPEQSRVGRLLAEAYASNFEPGHSLDDVELTLSADGTRLHSFVVGLRESVWDEEAVDEYEEDFAEALAGEPDYLADLDALCQAAMWHSPPHPGAGLADLTEEFPPWPEANR